MECGAMKLEEMIEAVQEVENRIRREMVARKHATEQAQGGATYVPLPLSTAELQRESRVNIGGRAVVVINELGQAEYRYRHSDGHMGAVED
jgi:hypothetical protein